MALSFFLLKRRFHWVHYIGCTFIVSAIILSIVTADDETHDGEENDISHEQAVTWSIVFFLANLPFALGGVVKEIVLSHPNPVKKTYVSHTIYYNSLCLPLLLFS